MNDRLYQVPPAIFTPAAIAVLAIVATVKWPWWALLAIPFAYLGSLCAMPNLNLANGCLAYVSMALGYGLSWLHLPSGGMIGIGAGLGFYLSAIEKRLRMRSVPADPPTDA